MRKVQLYFVLGSLLIATSCSAPNQLKREHFKPASEGRVASEVLTMGEGVESTRTLVAITILSWIMNVFKAMVKPARNMFLSLSPEISAVRCLSESREVQNMFGYNLDSSDDNFEGYFYETPRSSLDAVDLSKDRVLKRMPRFIDEVASLLKDGGTMSCVVPYMRERVVRCFDPIIGPADVIFKYSEKCKFTVPTLVDGQIRLFTRRQKLIIQTNLTFPYQISDDIEYEGNVATKRNGGWKPNFMKFQGTGVCSMLKKADSKLFDAFAKQLKASEPYKCPLPAGLITLDYTGADPTRALKTYGLEVLPYGELRVTANATLKGNVILCFRMYVDLVPKKRP
ncbi:hypothetical protein GE061_011591 [Apolygus lucorum]|uniref:Lipoprotein n=1 Tax=Apolygus lucorum TaxID=248454 RepID=A0A8S9Y0K5_APOLU|nr:hypothetical protein GE061_011591 [Apolygus lucorum]